MTKFAFDKDLFDARLKLATLRLDIRKDRISREWQVSLGLWTALGAYMISQKATTNVIQVVCLLAALAAAFGAHVFWIRWNFIRAEKDAEIAFQYHDAAAALLSEGAPPGPKPQPKAFWKHEPTIFQLLTTTSLCMGILAANFFGKVPDRAAVPVPVVVTVKIEGLPQAMPAKVSIQPAQPAGR